MPRSLWLSLGIGASVASAPLVGSPAHVATSGYFVDSSQVFAARPVRLEAKDGEFTYSVIRGAPDSTAAHLLRIAEATYPPRDLLVRIAAARGYEVGSDSARTPLWWCSGIGVSRIPYAITAGALNHYLELTDRFRRKVFLGAGTRPLFWSELTYRATISFRDTFVLEGQTYSGAYVADLKLLWSYDDGTFVPSTEAHRVVVLAPSGEVLGVVGDGRAVERVRISTHRGLG